MLAILLMTSSCATTNKRVKSTSAAKTDSNITGTAARRTLMPAGPIKEVAEKLVPNNKTAPDNHKYFVIIGSFRSYSNAQKHQKMVGKKGFVAQVLKNEAGLYRVSVMATDNIEDAHAEVRRIWEQFPEYSDTWMLVQIK